MAKGKQTKINTDLEPVKQVLRLFLSEIDEVKQLYTNVSTPQFPPFTIKDREPDLMALVCCPTADACWEKENALIWLFARAKNYRALMHRLKLPPISDFFNQLAEPIYDEWLESEKVALNRRKLIPHPGDRSLLKYLQDLARNIYKKNEKRYFWIKSLRSFLQYIREDLDFDQQGALEVIFPKEMCFQSHPNIHKKKNGEIVEKQCRYILRIVDEEISPIDIYAASDIIKGLSDTVLHGRANAQHTAAEALGFAWLCLAIGSARLMTLTREDLLYNLPLTALKYTPLEAGREYFWPDHFITIPTLYGPVDVPISKILYDTLKALPNNTDRQTIFSKAASSLLRTFYSKGVQLSERASKLGKITFRTLTSFPTEWIGHRPSLITPKPKL